MPGFADLGIDPVPFLHGLGEAVGELRRRLLDLLRAGDVEQAQTTLDAMDQIVDLLAEMDYPDGMTNGLRRTTDVSRALVERSRSDLTATVVQERLRGRQPPGANTERSGLRIAPRYNPPPARGCSSAWQSTSFATRGSRVQIPSAPLKNPGQGDFC